MQESIFLGLANNAAVLLSLWALYTIATLRPGMKPLLEKLLSGLAIGALGVAVLYSTVPFSPGVVFDTRTILLSMAGLFFGAIPTLIAAVITAGFRVWQGGAGVTMGVLTVCTSSVIGIGWRYLRHKHDQETRWYELYIFGVVVHIVMLLDALTLPADVLTQVYQVVAPAVMIIYPVVTVALGVLFSNQLIRKKLSLDLEKSEAKYRNIVETAEEGICSFDKDGNCIFVNHKFMEMSGYTLEELYERPYADMLDPRGREYLEEKIKNRRQGIRESYDLQLTNKYGKVIWVNVSASPIFDRDGNFAGALAMYTDITDRIRFQEELRKREEYYRILYQQSPLPYQSLDEEGRFNDVNAVWLESLGYERDEVIGRWFGEFLAVDDQRRFKTRFKRFLQTGEIHDVEFKMQCKDGKIIYISFDGRVGKDEQGAFDQAYCVWRDVTQIRDAQNALVESEEKLRALANYLQTAIETDRAYLAREIHDEFGQLMTGLKMDLAWCIRNHASIEKLQSRFESMNNLLDDAIQISRRLTSELRPGLLDDLGLIPAIEWYTGEFMHRSDIKCHYQLPESEPALESALKITVYRIFQEALTNIARHACATEARISLGFENSVVKLVVQDNGRGITSTDLDNNQSLGLLGLKERARQKGGYVEVTGRPGRGTKVLACLPFNDGVRIEVKP